MRTVLALVPRGRGLLAVLLGAAAVLTGTLLLATSGALITAASRQPESLLVLLPMITAVRLFAVSRATLRYAERVVAHDLTLRVVARLRVLVLERLVPLAPAALLGTRGGELLARVRSDVDELQGVVLRLAAPVAVAAVAGGVAVGLTATVSPPSALVLAVLLTVLGVAVPVLAARAGRGAAVTTARAEAATGAEVLDLVRGLADHLASDGGRTALATLDRALAAQQAAETRTARLTAATTLAREGVPVLGVVAALWFVGQDVTTGRTDPVLLAAAALGVLGAFEAVASLGPAWASAGRIRAAAARVTALSAQTPVVTAPEQPAPRPAGCGLVLDQVGFSYPEASSPVLAGMDLEVAPGEKVALVGPSGSGKSTVLALALRFWDPTSGRVLLGGVPADRLALDDVRAAAAWAPQAPQLLGGTLAGNLRLARPDATPAQLEAALHELGLGEVLQRVGLDGWIGEAGERLSAGERARVGLARVLLGPAPVLLLDEPTAHLDRAGADRVLQLLLTDPRAVLLVTHDEQRLDPAWRVVRLAGAPG
ncbi:thiol reductant ABC exporter subunit CydC [Auraticoccus sp. F435]|uniref:Thiol reductant ABC exporter subunit CydC n=1 Tax=Auraticoccus cholistanensis TaxID=2656650 RepID=A0A6A9V0N5_9ACTN|nr:thiol reductant ABC exporter subunit CydC [Auraticoccus cholistanensis]MVA75700.1 thiol reductant ABC exporter subunit CydC [Auraticoccus cholistanensis]